MSLFSISIHDIINLEQIDTVRGDMYGFTYLAGTPSVNAVTPNIGPVSGGVSVTVTGENFIMPPRVQGAWSSSGNSLPEGVHTGHAAVIGDTIYLFGGWTSTMRNTIYVANISTPTTWTNTGKTLPGGVSNGQLAVVGEKIYLYGGNPNVIYSADVADPTTWTDTGERLPASVARGEVVVVNDKMVLFGSTVNQVYSAQIIGAHLNKYNKPWLTSWPQVNGEMAEFGVLFDSLDATDINVISSTAVQAMIPPHTAGSVDVSVRSLDGQTATLQNGFEYLAPPTVSGIAPSSGSIAGGDTITINGSGFRDGAIAKIAGVAQATTVINENTLTFISPPSVFGTFTVTVINPDSQSAVLRDAFTYLSPPPEVTGVSPGAGRMSGGTSVTITGDNFLAPPSLESNGYDTGKNTPVSLSSSQIAIVDETVYLFGGLIGTNPVDVILSAPVSDPTTWTNTGKTLPVNPMHSRVAVIGDEVYLFGGWNSSAILSAPVSDPTTWTNTGKVLPLALGGSHLAIIEDSMYLIGGSSNVILSAPVSDPTTWTDTGATMPPLSRSQLAIIDGTIYFYTGEGTTAIRAIDIAGTQVNRYNKQHITNWTQGGSLIHAFNVTFDGVPATNITNITKTSITINTPAHAVGAVDVSIHNSDGQSATLTDGFTYLPEGYEFVTAPLIVAAGEPGAMTIRAVDDAGNPVSTPLPITLDLKTSSDSGFFARSLEEDEATRWNHTSVTIPAGQSQVTFYYKDSTQGTPAVTVTDQATTSVQQSQTIGPKYKLLVTGVTDPVKAGTPSSVTVQAVDYSGQPQTDYTGTVTFSSTDGGTLLPSDFTFTPDMLGLKTFVNGISMRTQGDWCVTATDTSQSTISGSQCGITVTEPDAGTISQLKIITPAQSLTAGSQSSAITVQTQDNGGVPIPVGNDTTIYVYGDSASGEFSADGVSDWSSSQPFVVTIPAGATAANVHYRDAVSGAHALTMRDDIGTGTDFGWTKTHN